MIISAISLWQPWASLMAIGAKKFETRSWWTPFGREEVVAIHAAKRWTRAQRELVVSNPPFHLALNIDPQEDINLPLGCIVAIARHVYCHRASSIRKALEESQNYWELAFGDFSEGRFAWAFTDVYQLPVPIPERGYQKTWSWTVPTELSQIVNEIEAGAYSIKETR